MSKNKKKMPGRPKKEFVSHKPKAKLQSWPGRPRKDSHIATNQVSPAVVSFVEKSVDDSKKKDMIILWLFLLSFILFVVSLYFTFMRDKTPADLQPGEIAEIANVDTGNIDYTTNDTENTTTGTAQEIVVPINDTVQPTVQTLNAQQQMIVDFYQAVNTVDLTAIYKLTDARLEESNVFKTYYSKSRLTKFSATILAPKIVVTNIQEEANTTNPNIKNFTYTLEYALANNQQKFTEERSTVLIKKGDNRRIGKLLCETKGCSTMPFFNPEKYK